MEKAGEKTTQATGWLKRIQEQSWEPEILISGIVLFSLIQIPPYIKDLGFYLDTYSFVMFSLGNVDDNLISMLFVANYWLITGFTAHLIFRSVWAAFVGLSYVYPDGVKTERLNYAPRYLKLLERGKDYKQNILRLEQICSIIFAVSFLLFMCIVGVTFFLLILIIFIGILWELNEDTLKVLSPYIDPVLIVISLIYLFDFVTLGLLKRIPVISKLYYPFYRVMSFLTLSPFYRSIYYGLVSNHKKWKIGACLFIFSIGSLAMVKFKSSDRQLLNAMKLNIEGSDAHVLYSGHYDNLMGDNPSRRIHLSSDLIVGNTLKAFVVHTSGFEESYIYPLCDYEARKKEEGDGLNDLKMECLSQFYRLQLNGEPVKDPEYLFHVKKSTGQAGLLTYLDISHLDKGQHTLSLQYQIDDEPRVMAIVEFYKTDSSGLY